MTIHSETALRVIARKREAIRRERANRYSPDLENLNEKWKGIYYAIAYGASPRRVHEQQKKGTTLWPARR